MTSDALSRGLTFDAAAAAYDQYRPRYPESLFAALRDQTGLTPTSRILEVGSGTGKATSSLVSRGWNVLAVEPGGEMAQMTREKFDRGLFDVEVATFDEWDPQGRTFDVLFSATAYHWVHPSLRWTKAAQILRPGGYVAVTTICTVSGASFNQFYEGTADLHGVYGLEEGSSEARSVEQLISDVSNAGTDIGAVWERIWREGTDVVAGDLFEGATVTYFPWQVHYTTDDTLGLFSTNSSYLNMDAPQREELFGKMREIIDRQFGGDLVRNYLAILSVARRR